MAPRYPDEVDLFTVPHSRMKQLVHKYLDLVSSSNFRDASHMTSVLEKLCHTFHAFRAHEQIENHFIMRRLKEKLTALRITDTAVCNCHSDNRLMEMMSMVQDGYHWAQRSEKERVRYGLRLRRALEDFTQVFIPHMNEEEEVFQPMLIKYFSYDELKELKIKVIQQHLQRVEEANGDEKFMPECDSDKEEEEEDIEPSVVEQLPTEVMMNVLSYLSPQDLGRCAQVSQKFNQLAMDPSLWPAIYPVHWATGDWSFNPVTKDEEEEVTAWEEEEGDVYVDDEDADRDESSDSESSETQDDGLLQRALKEVRLISGLVKHVLPRVGAGVERCNLSHSRGISSSLVHKILKLCPNLRVLTLAHTRITDAAFKEYAMKGIQCKLEHLDLSSCENITDSSLRCLAGSQFSTRDRHQADVAVSCQQCDRNSLCVDMTMLSVCDDDRNLSEDDPIIVQDPSFTDLAMELCNFDSQDLCVERAHISSILNVQSDNAGCCQKKDNVSGCCVKRTCCSSENRDSTWGCCGKQTGEPASHNDGRVWKESNEQPHALHKLTHLSLNSCYRITDEGLKTLSERGGLPQLQHLDLSGCINLTGKGVASLVDSCQSLDHSFLFYCDNLYPDPYPASASGCRNLQCGTRFCCRSGE